MATTFANEYVSPKGIRYWLIENDVYGNPRYVVHYLSVSADSDGGSASNYASRQAAQFSAAMNRVGGKRYRGKWFGGGIVFQSYDGDRGVGEWLDTLAAEAGAL